MSTYPELVLRIRRRWKQILQRHAASVARFRAHGVFSYLGVIGFIVTVSALWNAELELVQVLKGHTDIITCLALQGGQTLFSGRADG